MNAPNIWIYEDDNNAAQGWADRIREASSEARVQVAQRKDVEDLFKTIHERRSQWRTHNNNFDLIEHDIDSADVVVLDYDLLEYWEGYASDTTGSRLAYLLRCFTKCGFIIVLNEHGHNVFDFRLGNPTDGFADLHIGGQQIGNPGLWNQPPFIGYRPWHWPVIPHAQKNFEKCVGEVEECLKNEHQRPLIEFLDLNRVIDWMPMRARDFLTGGKKPIEQVTFEDFVMNSRGGIEAKDKIPPSQTARVAAGRIIALLNNIILPEQNALVDAPHLVSRFGSVFREVNEGIESWNKLCDPVNTQIDYLLEDLLKDYRFPKSHWLWRPAWFWPEVSSNEEIKEVRDPWSSTESPSDRVFCEDVSRFMRTEHTRSFRASVSPPFIKRYVCKQDCEEARRSVGDMGDNGPTSLSNVEYVPQAAFSQ